MSDIENSQGNMFRTAVEQRIATMDLLPELKVTLTHLIEEDALWVEQEWRWNWIIPAVQQAFGGESANLRPFAAAWALMYAAIVRLDHLQDGDPHGGYLSAVNSSVQYNILLSYYVLAASLLDELSPTEFPPLQILRLQRLWNDLMLRTASGQQRDLVSNPQEVRQSLDQYQEIALAKTGATFGLAFGGVATLLDTNTTTTEIMTELGTIFGALIQYADDITDALDQPNSTLTLPSALAGIVAYRATDADPSVFLSYVYAHYYRHVQNIAASLPRHVAQQILVIFQRAFGSVPEIVGAMP